MGGGLESLWVGRVYGADGAVHGIIRHTIVVCSSSISPIASGCFICVNINLVIILDDISSSVMSGGILFKMLVLGINEMVLYLSSEALKGYSLFLIYKTNILY